MQITTLNIKELKLRANKFDKERKALMKILNSLEKINTTDLSDTNCKKLNRLIDCLNVKLNRVQIW